MKERLIALQNFKLDKLAKAQEMFYRDWINNKYCSCVERLKDGEVLTCKHITKARIIKFKNERDDCWNRTIKITKCKLHIRGKSRKEE